MDRDLEGFWMGGLVVSPDGKTVALNAPKQTIQLLDLATGKARQTFQRLMGHRGMAFTADSQSLVEWSFETIRIWDVRTSRRRDYPLPREDNGEGSARYFSVAPSPDGRLLAIGSQHLIGSESPRNHFLILKDVQTGRDFYRRDQLPSGVGTSAFSPDGRMLAWSGFLDPTVRLLEVASGHERIRFTGHRGAVQSLRFTPDGERLVSGSMDTTALVWDISSRFDPRKPPLMLKGAEMDAHWTDFAATDAARAFRAIRELAAAPASAVPYLRSHVQPIPSVDDKRVRRLIDNLDSDDFAVRRKSVAGLEAFAEKRCPLTEPCLKASPPSRCADDWRTCARKRS